MMDDRIARLQAKGELESVRADIQGLADTLGQLSIWRPAAGLRKACDAALQMLAQMAERFDRKLVVTLVGPCGSGKSTLLNALAGDDRLSQAGHRRPTTDRVVAFCSQSDDADQLLNHFGPDEIRIHARDTAQGLAHLILIDTPDTDSTHRERHIPIVHKVIGLSDVLICVFDGENPKRRDHTDFMADYVRLFSGASLVVAVNKCDRLSESELTDTIMPEFADYIRDAWPVAPAAMLCVSARSHLNDPDWDPQARPKHHRDQFDQLQQLIGESFNQAGFSVDRRLENARSLRSYLQESVHEQARASEEQLSAATTRMAACESEAMQQAVAAFGDDGDLMAPGINIRLYQQLAQRWLGPVGWLVAVWTRVLVFGSGIAALLRFGNPLRQMAGAVSAVRHYASPKKAVDAADHGSGAPLALLHYDRVLAREWPDIAELLVDAGFAPSVREAHRTPGHGEQIGRHLSQIWNEALEAELSQAGRRLSGGLLQLLFNLPVIGVLAYTGWLTAVNFFSNQILTGDFFLHAFWTIVVVLFLSFFLLQAVIRLAASRQRILRRVFSRLRKAMEHHSSLPDNPLWQQAKMIEGLKN